MATKTVKIQDKIKDLSDVYKLEPENQRDIFLAEVYKRACAVVRALNEGWEPDWSNPRETKYTIYYRRNSGRSWSVAYTIGITFTAVLRAYISRAQSWQCTQQNNFLKFLKRFTARWYKQ